MKNLSFNCPINDVWESAYIFGHQNRHGNSLKIGQINFFSHSEHSTHETSFRTRHLRLGQEKQLTAEDAERLFNHLQSNKGCGHAFSVHETGPNQFCLTFSAISTQPPKHYGWK